MRHTTTSTPAINAWSKYEAPFEATAYHERLSAFEHVLQLHQTWQHPQQATSLMRRHHLLSQIKRLLEHTTQQLEDARLLLELIQEQDAVDELPSVHALLNDADLSLDVLQWRSLLSESDSEPSAFVCIQALETDENAADWVCMLVHMIVQLSERLGFATHVLEPSHTTTKAVIHAVGRLAYGWLRSEAGIHTVTHTIGAVPDAPIITSQALITVLADPDNAPIEINMKDLVMDQYRSAGRCCRGCHRHAAIRITHIPSGLSATVYGTTTHRAKATALRLLHARFLHNQKTHEVHVVRSIELGPNPRATDPITEFTSTRVCALLNGECEPFILARLRSPWIR